MSSKKRLYQYWVDHQIITDQRLLEAFIKIPRENFVREEHLIDTYGDHPLPIGKDQTISQPSTVMMMLQWLELEEGHRVLEIGAGSGYNAALIAQIVAKVFTVERIPHLEQFAKENLKKTDIDNVQVILGDGKQGYPQAAPYDRIIVTAATSQVPQSLLEQLKEGGILLLPLGPTLGCEMTKICKVSQQKYSESYHGLFSFVPLV